MAEHNGSWYALYNEGVQWDASGKPYYKTSDGMKDYIPPITAAQYHDDPKMLAWAKAHGSVYTPGKDGQAGTITNDSTNGGDFFHHRSEWNSESGDYENNFDWGSVLTLAVAGFLTAGVATAMLGGGPAAQTAVDTALASGSPEAGAAAAGVTTSTAISGAEGGALASSTIAPLAGALPAVAPSGAVASGLAGGVGAGVGVGETGASTGLASTTGLQSTPGVGLGEMTATTGLPSTAGLPGAAATPSITDLVANGNAIPNVGADGNSLTDIISKGSDVAGRIGKLGNIAGAAGAGIADATRSAGNTQLQNALLGLSANNQNITGHSAYETELMNRAKQEAGQRRSALADIYRENVTSNPRISPFNPVGAPKQSPAYMTALGNLSGQGQTKLSKGAQYDTDAMSPLAGYKDYNPNTMTGAGGTIPSTLQTVGNWLSPTLSTIGALAELFK